MKKQIITLMCATALLSSCHIYKSYDRPEDITAAGLYRDTTAVNDTLAADTATSVTCLGGKYLPTLSCKHSSNKHLPIIQICAVPL